MYDFLPSPLFSGEKGEEGEQFPTQNVRYTLSTVLSSVTSLRKALQESIWRVHSVIEAYSRPWGLEPEWAEAALGAGTVVMFLLLLLLYINRDTRKYRHIRDPTCRTEKERQLTEQVWTSSTAIACLTRELEAANDKVAELDGQLEQLLAFIMDQETESSGEIRSLKDQAALLENERAILLGVAQQQEQLIELLKASNFQWSDTEALKTCEKSPRSVGGGDGGVTEKESPEQDCKPHNA